MPNSRRLISNAAVSVVQTVISGVVLFLLYRYLLDHLGTEQLGLWSVILASTSVARLSDLGLTGSVVKFVARYRALKNDEQGMLAARIHQFLKVAKFLAEFQYLLLSGSPFHAVMEAGIEIAKIELVAWLDPKSIGHLLHLAVDGGRAAFQFAGVVYHPRPRFLLPLLKAFVLDAERALFPVLHFHNTL